MAAETLTATRAAATFPIPENSFAGVVQAHWGVYAVAANVEDGDIFEMHQLPDGAIVVSGEFRGDDLDTGTEALDMDIGWAANNTDTADPDGFGNLGVLTGDAVTGIKPETCLYYPYNGVLKDGPKAFSVGGGLTMVQVEANVAANSFTAGDIYALTLYTTN